MGNLTSQLFANIYLNELDQFIKHRLKVKYYLRYTDDFVIIADDKSYLLKILELVRIFLRDNLKLELHPNKIVLKKYRQGLDFLGYIALPHYNILRTKTKNRMIRKFKKKVEDYNEGLISKEKLNQSLQSYLGVLGHVKGCKIKRSLLSVVGPGFLPSLASDGTGMTRRVNLTNPQNRHIIKLSYCLLKQ